MGNYVSSSSLSQRVGSTRLAALCASADESQDAIVAAAIARAEALIDGYAATRYATPLSSCSLLEEWALRVAEYELYKRGPGDSVPQKVKDSYQDALAQLQALAAGSIKLNAQKPASSTGVSIAISGKDVSPLFGQTGMKGF